MCPRYRVRPSANNSGTASEIIRAEKSVTRLQSCRVWLSKIAVWTEIISAKSADRRVKVSAEAGPLKEKGFAMDRGFRELRAWAIVLDKVFETDLSRKVDCSSSRLVIGKLQDGR